VARSQSVTIGSNGLRLEAKLHYPGGRSPSAAAVVGHPHPLYGGDMYNSVVGMVVSGLNAAGLIAFTFNFRGVGNSEGQHDNGAGEQDDVRAALDYVRRMPGIEKVALAGYSFGAGMAADVVDASVERLALVALPTRRLESAALSAYEGPVLLATGSNDTISSLEAVEAKAAALGSHVSVAAVNGADHSFWGQEEPLAEAIRDFFAPILAAPSA
jgi:alpha/beta superfamily hydrolase